MKLNLLRSLAVAALAAPLCLAQTYPAKTPASKTPAAKSPAPAVKSDPPRTTVAASMLNLPVAGLTADNAAKVQAALKDFSNSSWRCATCGKASFEAGTCCGKDRVAQSGMALSSVSVDAAAGSLAFAVQAGHAVRLTEIERLLQAQGVSVQRDHLALGQDATLLVTGAADAAAGQSIRKALVDAQLAEQVDVTQPTGKHETEVVLHRKAGSPPTEEHVREVLAKANSAFGVTDVIWSTAGKS